MALWASIDTAANETRLCRPTCTLWIRPWWFKIVTCKMLIKDTLWEAQGRPIPQKLTCSLMAYIVLFLQLKFPTNSRYVHQWRDVWNTPDLWSEKCKNIGVILWGYVLIANHQSVHDHGLQDHRSNHEYTLLLTLPVCTQLLHIPLPCFEQLFFFLTTSTFVLSLNNNVHRIHCISSASQQYHLQRLFLGSQLDLMFLIFSGC